MDTSYQAQYKEFIDHIAGGNPIDAKSIGELIVGLAHFFSDAIALQAKTEFAYQKCLATFEKSSDDAGKPLSSAKAESYARASAEYGAYLEARGHVMAIDAMINALKAYQKGALNEFSHFGQQA